jgi:hypothetical protein
VEVRSCNYLNNIVEQDHRAIKSRCSSMKGFKSFNKAAVTIAGIELAQRIHKRHFSDFNPATQVHWKPTEGLCRPNRPKNYRWPGLRTSRKMPKIDCAALYISRTDRVLDESADRLRALVARGAHKKYRHLRGANDLARNASQENSADASTTMHPPSV